MLIFIYVFLVYSATILHTSCVVHDIYWRDYVPGDIPCDAYQGAPGKYIGQVNINSNNLPATILTHSHTAVAELGGKQTIKQDIKILCSPNNNRFYWDFVDLDKFEDLHYQDAVKGGFESENHVQAYIGKVSHERDWKIGKAFIPEGLWVWNAEDKAVNFHQFFLLKYNRTDCCIQQRIV